jgi:hypothetical protein
MSLQNFIPTIWAGEILNTFQQSHVLAALCNRDYEGLIRGQGDTVKINAIGEISVSSYSRNSTSITPEELQTAQTTLLIDKAKYFAFKVDDVDAAQANVRVMQKAMQKAAYKISEGIDQGIAGLYASAANTVTDATFDSLLALNTIMTASQYLDEAGAPKAGRWLVLPPWAITKLVITKILVANGTVNADNEFANGFVGRIGGFNVYESNNLSQSGTAPNYTTYGLAGVPEAISFAEQLVKVEAYRPESSFSDAIKGLHVYGYKVIQPSGLVALCLTYSAETT